MKGTSQKSRLCVDRKRTIFCIEWHNYKLKLNGKYFQNSILKMSTKNAADWSIPDQQNLSYIFIAPTFHFRIVKTPGFYLVPIKRYSVYSKVHSFLEPIVVTSSGPGIQSYPDPNRICFLHPTPEPTRRILPGTQTRVGSGRAPGTRPVCRTLACIERGDINANVLSLISFRVS